MIGQTISHYKITAKLGEGGMGVVNWGEAWGFRFGSSGHRRPLDGTMGNDSNVAVIMCVTFETEIREGKE